MTRDMAGQTPGQNTGHLGQTRVPVLGQPGQAPYKGLSLSRGRAESREGERLVLQHTPSREVGEGEQKATLLARAQSSPSGLVLDVLCLLSPPQRGEQETTHARLRRQTEETNRRHRRQSNE
jgi:hypothetical protein